MAPMAKGNVRAGSLKRGKPSKTKSGTATTRQHRFETFSQRVAKFRVEPVRRAHQARAFRSLEDEACHFKTSLQEWKDLNLSENFVEFGRQADPLCQNLPQVLHYQEKIMDLLILAIDKEDALSLEPLLSLMVHFAHDLGARFEVFFQRAVATINRLASKHTDIHVIEWSFTSLAWIFKYLSKLLVKDLRPLYDLMAPLLGKEQQKDFVTRFAAEAMSYLVRKASTMYEKSSRPLDLVVEHALVDLDRTPQDRTSQYQAGLVHLFTDSMAGFQKGLHSGATNLLRVMIQHCSSQAEHQQPHSALLEEVISGILSGVDAVGFQIFYAAVLEATSTPNLREGASSLKVAASVLFTTTESVQITDVGEWSSLAARMDGLVAKLELEADGTVKDLNTTWNFLNVIISIIQHTIRDDDIPGLASLVDRIQGNKWKLFFLDFCVATAERDPLAFKSRLLSCFQRFLDRDWVTHELQICLALPRVLALAGDCITIPAAWQQKMLTKLQTLSVSNSREEKPDQHLLLCNFYLDILRCGLLDGSMHKNFVGTVQDLVRGTIEHPAKDKLNCLDRLMLAKGLSFVAVADPDISQVWPKLCGIAPAAVTFPAYLEALRTILTTTANFDPRVAADVEVLVQELIENLTAPVHELRLLSLQVLSALYTRANILVPPTLDIAISIENTPFTLDNARAAALAVRRLGVNFHTIATDSWLRRALPAYCFGLHHVRLSSLWDDATNALETMVDVKSVDGAVMERITAWLRGPSDTTQEDYEPHSDLNLSSAKETIDTDVSKRDSDADEIALCILTRHFENDFRSLPRQALHNREQALRILNKIPHVAEKRSRILVPILLAWAGIEDSDQVDHDANERGAKSTILPRDDDITTSTPWSRPDQKSLLNLFAQFQNPTVLYRSADVYQALLALLGNGDAMIQKSALKAIFSWKSMALRPYQENLLNLLDDARFRDELSVFLGSNAKTDNILPEHRAVLMPVVLRLLYGRIVNRSDSKHGSNSQEAKRKAILVTLAEFGKDELEAFVNIVLGPLREVQVLKAGHINEDILQQDIMQLRKQQGLLRLLEDMLQILPHVLGDCVARLANAVLYCAGRCRRLSSATGEVAKTIRQDALKCLHLLFAIEGRFDWSPYVYFIVEELIVPRLQNLPIETAQGISAILKLISGISQSERLTELFLTTRRQVFERVADCLTVLSARDEVKVFILNNIFRNLIQFADGESNSKKSFGSTVAAVLFPRLSKLLERMPARECLEATVETIISLGNFVDMTVDAASLTKSSGTLLQQPSRFVSPRMKGGILRLLDQVLPLHDFSEDKDTFTEFYRTLSSLFAYFKDSPNRQMLVHVFQELVKHDSQFVEVADLCKSLNSVSTSRLDEPDFDARLRAFDIICNQRYESFTAQQWLPLIHNMLFYIHDNDELSIRTSSGLALRRFAQAANTAALDAVTFETILFDDIFPILLNGSTDPSELVRAENIAVLAEVVRGKWTQTTDLKILLGPEDEASFFNNILHIQQHRRIRALKRLAVDSVYISSTNINRFCIPLVQTYLSDTAEDTQNVAAEAASTLEVLCQGLSWSHLQSLLKKLVDQTSKLESKSQIRGIGAAVNALAQSSRRRSLTTANLDAALTSDITYPKPVHLANSLPTAEKISSSLSKSVLTKLMDYIHYKDESTVDLRVILAVMVVKIIMILPAQEVAARLPAVIMDVCNILRSRAQEARDAARLTLSEIAALIGPVYFEFILKQLRGTLQRGYQVHVLSYTIHSILYSVTSTWKPGDLDQCLPDLMAIILDDIFGIAGQEKDAEDYIKGMKEVKAKRLSYDSMKLLATITTLPHISDLLNPIQAQIEQPRPKMDKIDDVLHTLREGLRGNSSIQDRQALTLCYEILQKAYKNGEGTYASTSSLKLIGFGLGLLERIIKKHETLKTVENLAGFMPFLTLSLAHGEEEVQIAAFRLLNSCMKIALPELDQQANDYLRKVSRTIQSSASTNTPLAQEALKLGTSILLERPNAVIKQSQFESQMALLLDKLKPDLHEPAREAGRGQQLAAFKFLKAVLGRGVLIKEVYEIMEVVREVMLTSQENSALEEARNVYSRFVLDYYPEGGKGFDKQMKFLMTNLRYPHERGRKAVMEVMFFIIRKKSDVAVQGVLEELFLPLMVALATDDSKECQASAKIVLQKMFGRADKDRMRIFKSRLFAFLETASQPVLKRISLECWSIYFSEHADATKDAAEVYDHLARLLSSEEEVNGHEAMLRTAAALDLTTQIGELFPALAFRVEAAEEWSIWMNYLRLNQPIIQLSTVKLIRLYLGHFLRQAAGNSQPRALPLTGSEGLSLTAVEASKIVRESFDAIQTTTSEILIEQLAENVSIIGRLAAGGSGSQHVLDRLLRQAAAVIRRDDSEDSLRARVATLKFAIRLCKDITTESLQPSLRDMLLPLLNVTDSAVSTAIVMRPENVGLNEELVRLAQEMLDDLQIKLGTSKFVAEMQIVQKAVRARREERRAKRLIETVSAPEKAGRDKQRKNEVKRIKRQEKNARAAGHRRGW